MIIQWATDTDDTNFASRKVVQFLWNALDRVLSAQQALRIDGYYKDFVAAVMNLSADDQVTMSPLQDDLSNRIAAVIANANS